MKRLLTILSLTILTYSCSTFTETKIIDNQDELKKIFEIGLRNKIQKFTWGDEDIDGLNWKLQKHQIDYFEIKINGDKKTKTVIDIDSVVIFTRNSKNIFDDQDNIVYDFAKTSRKLGTFVVEMADYDQKMVADRWYLVRIGFD